MKQTLVELETSAFKLYVEADGSGTLLSRYDGDLVTFESASLSDLGFLCLKAYRLWREATKEDDDELDV